MDTLSPQGALLAVCIARLPGRRLPRHAWAAEVLVEQLWAQSIGPGRASWSEALAPLIVAGHVDARRVRGEIWEMARTGALKAEGTGSEACFVVPREVEMASLAVVPLACADPGVVDDAVAQLTARLFTASK